MAEKTFTEAMASLQKAASDISKQTTNLEDSLKLFEQGMADVEFCREILDKANQRISIYEKESENA